MCFLIIEMDSSDASNAVEYLCAVRTRLVVLRSQGKGIGIFERHDEGMGYVDSGSTMLGEGARTWVKTLWTAVSRWG
jgi:hypothetical protein